MRGIEVLLKLKKEGYMINHTAYIEPGVNPDGIKSIILSLSTIRIDHRSLSEKIEGEKNEKKN